MLETPLFPIADALQQNLTLDTVDGVSSYESRPIDLGPWKVHAYMQVSQDFLNDKSSGVFVKFRKSLWAYMVCFIKGTKPTLYTVLFDGKAAGIRMAEAKKFGAGTAHDTIQKLGTAVRVCLKFKNDQWVICDVGDLVQRSIEQGPVVPGPGPEDLGIESGSMFGPDYLT